MPKIRFFARTGTGPITIKLWNELTLVQVGVAGGYAATEHASVKTMYETANIELAGSWIVTAVDANGETLSGFCRAALSDAYVYAQDPSPSLAQTIAAALRAGVVVVRKPLSDDGELTLVRGDTYDDWVNPAIEWEVSSAADLSTAVATLSVKVSGETLPTTGTITALGGGLWEIAFKPSVPWDFPVGEGRWDFELKSAAGTNVATPESGLARVKLDVTRNSPS